MAGGRRTLAALLTTLSIALVLVVPVVVIGVGIADDARALAGATRKWMEAGPPKPPAWLERIPLVGRQAKGYWTEFTDDAARLLRELKPVVDDPSFGSTNLLAVATDSSQELVAQAQPPLTEKESRLVKALKSLVISARTAMLRAGLAIGRGVIEVVLSVFLAFFIFRDGAAVTERLTTGVGRIAGERGKHLLDVAGRTVRGVVYGILGTALVQGVMAAIDSSSPACRARRCWVCSPSSFPRSPWAHPWSGFRPSSGSTRRDRRAGRSSCSSGEWA